MLDILLFLFMVGLGAGTLGSVIGIGGGIIITPALTLMGFTPVHIASTSLIAVTSTSASSTIAYYRQKKIDYSTALKMVIFSIPGSIVGAFISNSVSLEFFKLSFSILLMLTGTYILFRNSILKNSNNSNNKPKNSISLLLCYAGTFIAGIISSLFGVGGGIIFVPIMVLIFQMTMAKAAPTSQLILFITSLMGTFTHILLSNPDYFNALSLAAGAFIGGQIGAILSNYLRESILQKLLSIFLIATAIKFMLDVILES
ncbi:MAG: sulfite exporter TauE/SafE family protein [Thermoproteota archaeon]|nr:sulfite exporter TauE/SafE family protein [Thermoproteota archaeon]